MKNWKAHHYAIVAAVAFGGIGLVYWYNKSTAAKAAQVASSNANSTNFIGRTPYYNANGNVVTCAPTPSHPYAVSVAAGK